MDPLNQVNGELDMYMEFLTKIVTLEEENKRINKQLYDTKIQNSKLILASDKTHEDWNTCKKELDAYKKYLALTESIDTRIQDMDTCISFLKSYCDCLKDEDHHCAKQFFGYLKCEDVLPQNYYDKIKASYHRLLKDILMVKMNLTDLLITGNFEMMQGIYEQKKGFLTDNCHFICNLEVEDLDAQFNATYWKAFEDSWKLFTKYLFK